MDGGKLEPLNDGLPECFRFCTPGFLGEINMETLRFPATAPVTDTATSMTYIERGRERATKTDQAWILTGGIGKPWILCGSVCVMDHVRHRALSWWIGPNCVSMNDDAVSPCIVEACVKGFQGGDKQDRSTVRTRP
jgi:hypothetical protein